MLVFRNLADEDIVLDLVTKGKQSALSKISARLAKRNSLDNELVLQGFLHRERLGSTGIGRGVAIPHTLLNSISSPVRSFTRLANPIDFNGPDGDPVDLLFTLLWPRSAVAAFLPALSQFCRMIRMPCIREGLRSARSASEVNAILSYEDMCRLPVSRAIKFTMPKHP